MAIDWVVITGNTNKEAGAIGFIGNTASVVVSFYDDADGDMDGEVSWGEWVASKISPIGLGGIGVSRVAMAARFNSDVVLRDPEFMDLAINLFSKFAFGMVADGLYTVYLSRSVSSVAKGIAGRAATGLVKQFVIKKGMEAAVKKAYKASIGY